jgi:UDP-3-O-[3-hydroxymyristoyl] N-acetylglucosamine deacetylase
VSTANLQQTLKNSVKATGVALHSGRKVNLTLHPAKENRGIIFKRTDLEGCVEFPAVASSVGDTQMATSLTCDNHQLSTVEHLMSALSGLGVDNAIVEVDGRELPIMDGSAAPFVFLLESAGLTTQSAPKKFLRVLREVRAEDGDASVVLMPYEGFKLSYTLEYDHPVFTAHEHTAEVEFSKIGFVKEVSRARTFGFLADFEKLRDLNLAQGGSLNNAVVVDDSKILNEHGLRARDEFVKHKILDAIGDLYLLGHSLIGSFHGHKSGHGLNNKVIRKLLDDPSSYEIVTFEDPSKMPATYFGSAPYLDD